MRLAWFTPLPPIRSGIALYNTELLPHLRSHTIDVFVDCLPTYKQNGANGVFTAHDFIWKHTANPYDLVVYQLGNSPYHDYMWPYLVRYPGLTVLHDGQLHHARGRSLLQDGRKADYRSEFRFNHPDAGPDIPELGILGLLGSLTYLWPMTRVVVESSRLLVVHESWLAAEIRESLPQARVDVISMGVPEPSINPQGRASVRARHGISSDAILFAAFGKITPEKRIAEALRAASTVEPGSFPIHILLCGEPVEHYDALADAERLGIGDRVTITGYIPTNEMPHYITAADACLCLRWPSARETSASWLRCLAAGQPTIVTDLVHLTNVPVLDPRNWKVSGYSAGRDELHRRVNPVCVAIDILDEDHSLMLAMQRLAVDAQLRRELGENARSLWNERFKLESMVTAYERVLSDALQLAIPRRNALPPHLLRDGTRKARELLTSMDIKMTSLRTLKPHDIGHDVESS